MPAPPGTVVLHIGVRWAHARSVGAFLMKNEAALADQGFGVINTPSSSWAEVLTQPPPAHRTYVGSDHELLRYPESRIRQLADAVASWNGRLVAVCLIARGSDLAVQQYTSELRAGRSRRLSPLLKTLNYVPGLLRWQRVLGVENVVLRAPDMHGALSSVPLAVAEELDIDTDGLWVPPGSKRLTLNACTAEALRRVNVVLHDIDEPRARRLRRRAIALLRGASQPDDPPLAMRPAAAEQLDATLAHEIPDLESRLQPLELHRVLPRGRYPQQQEFEPRLAEVWRGLRSDPRLTAVLPASSQDVSSHDDRLRQLRTHVATAQGSEEMASLAAELRSELENTDDFMLIGPSAPRSIPGRLVQYWEPLPLPPYMVPWVQSWNDVGFPGSSILVSRDEARDLVGLAIGPKGLRAFDLTVHPAQRSDLFRYADLLMNGGWYVDADHEALVPHDEVLTWPVRHVLVRRRGRHYPNGFIGAVRDSWVMEAALARSCANILRSNGQMPTMKSTGPLMFTSVVNEYLARPDASAVIIPGRAAFGNVLQRIHLDAPYKIVGHWRDA